MVELNSVQIEKGFPAIVGKQPKVLILGTMPSVQSLKSQQYYGNPRNAFWWIMSQLLGFDEHCDYGQRTEHLQTHRIALWDVIARCHRPGSLDSRIAISSVEVNPLTTIMKETSLNLVVFNGKMAANLFKRFLPESDWQGVQLTMPSTSPANAMLSREQKLKQWSQIKDYF